MYKDSREKGKKGLVVLSSKKKLSFLSDPKYFRYKGFQPAEEAKHAPAPFTTYSLFYNGEFVTNEILSAKKFEKI
jgi:hypothetical protein